MEDIGADLGSPLDLLHLTLDVRHLLFPLTLVQFNQLTLQHAQGHLAVLHL